MDVLRLRQMVEQIAANLAIRGHAKAVAATADHIETFWDPRMKAAICADDRGALSMIAAEAIGLVASRSVLPRQTRATEFNAGDGLGHSDAG